MPVGTLISVDEYLRTSFHPDCDFIEGEIQERTLGQIEHSYAQGEIVSWLNQRKAIFGLQALPELRMRVSPTRVRIPDVVACEIPIPKEPVLTAPPYLSVEVVSPDDTVARLQDRLDDYLQFGVPNSWVIDPWKHRGWHSSAAGWATATDAIMRTADGRIAMPLADVLLP